MKGEWVKKLTQLTKSDVKIAGGKGASLGEMIKIGIPVPPGFVVLSNAFDKFLEETNLKEKINSILSKINIEDIHFIENASSEIHKMILSNEIPEYIKQDIWKNYKELNSKYVAVRSSATVEDSKIAAWAGQLETYLNVTKENLFEFIKRCWASLFTSRAIFYRFEKKLDKQEISVAVVIQKMVDSEKSGIAFSVHPVTQDKNQIIIEAGFGLGEAIVSGLITPDSYIVDKQGFKILDVNVNKQEKGLYRKLNGGVEWRYLGDKGKNQVLSEKEIIELSKIVAKIEKYYGFPVDVEWANKDGKFYILQSRPITTISISQTNKNLKSNFNYTEKYLLMRERVNMLSPVYWNGLSQTSSDTKKIHGVNISKLWHYFKDGKIKAIYLKQDWDKAAEVISERILNDEQYFRDLQKKLDIVAKKVYSFLQNLKNKSFSNLSFEGLVDLAEKLRNLWLEYDRINVLPWFVGGDKLKRKIQYILKLPEDVFLFLTTPIEKSFVSKLEFDILKYAKLVKEGEDLEKFARILSEEYGWIPFEYDGPTYWDEDYFINLLKEKIKDSIKKINEQIEKIKQKEEENLEKRKILIEKYKLDEKKLNLLNKIVKLIKWTDERKKVTFNIHYYYHKVLLEISKRFNIPYKNLKYLFTEELKNLKFDKENVIKVSNLRIKNGFLVEYQNGKYNILGDKSKDKILEEIEKQINKKDIIKGVVVSKGSQDIYHGKVKVVSSAKECDKIEDGDILVTTMTTPDYAPVFKKISAIITDEGGITCHAAIVSRELGIPCVVGTKVATKILKDGDFVEIDFDKGVIKKIKQKLG